MSNLPARVPKSVLPALVQALGANESAEAVLRIRITDGLNVQEFAAYLQFIDRAYGRLTAGDLYRYSRARRKQLQISAKPGSLWLELASGALGANPSTIAVIWLALKHLPLAFEKTGKFIVNVSGSYKNVEEGRLARAQRKEIERKAEGSGL